MAVNAWKKAVWPGANPNAHKKKDPSKPGNGTRSYEDKHGMERHKMPLPPKDKPHTEEWTK
jgi:hypothetical protein